ncbi:sporulation protein YtfJ [Paenibacillus shirakamiensis]|uniref:Sporulation protein YtfJ n=1 Tax=Paenibacillus shirakamiensis TaxID=1265935 RepID=A0ABS4JFY8_9BACL|nr:GerW family sporulation protein [Paenibacillus shirakamiensis]MBP1999499.1 sporulation protein YtfJ [Paenibacillus shirakamiensis]
MAEHPIQGLMQTALENIKEMVDVNTIVGEAVETPDGSVILPISRVGFGFAAGGSDFNIDEKFAQSPTSTTEGKSRPFGGGSGGGVSINPIAFLVVGKQGVHVVPLDNQTHVVEKMIDAVPNIIDKIQTMIASGSSKSSTSSNSSSTSVPPEQINVTVKESSTSQSQYGHNL